MHSHPTRRQFVRNSAAATAALAALPAIQSAAHAGGREEIRVGVVGAGGRGKGACHDCLRAYPGVKIVAIGDLTTEICSNARNTLKKTNEGERVEVPDENLFAGLNAYKQVINHPDVDAVILTTSPGFRPLHLAEAVAAGKHVFVEKPVCVDPAGYRSCLESGKIAKENNTAIVTGTMYRRQKSYMEGVKRIHDGMIGRIMSGLAYYCSAGIWYRKRKPGMTDMEYQLYNWYHFVWLCGDQIVEQAVHNIDAINWIMGGPPVKAYGSGGQMTRPADSEIYDHISIDYEYANGANVSFKCRQIPGSKSSVRNTIYGSDGVAYINPGNTRIKNVAGDTLFMQPNPGNNPYVQEHVEFIESIREGKPIMEIDEVAHSSLTGVMGRLAAYSGQEITWDFVTKSKLDLMPKDPTFDTPIESPGVVIPGRYELI